MSTTYVVVCESGQHKVTLSIIDSINPLPGSDTWSTADVDEWGIDSGAVASWGTPDLELHGVGAAPVASLFGFRKATSRGDTGTGEKQYPEGIFPSGGFQWRCISKN